MSGKSADDRAVSELHDGGQSAEAVRVKELADLVALKLKHPLENTTFYEFAAIQNSLWDTQSILESRLDLGTIDKQEYLDCLGRAMQTAMSRSRELLGEKRFDAIFGETGYEPQGLIDQQAFLSDK